MPKTVRQWAMRKLTQSIKAMDWSITHLNDIDNLYKKEHPEISKEMLDTMTMIQLMQAHVEKLRTIF